MIPQKKNDRNEEEKKEIDESVEVECQGKYMVCLILSSASDDQDQWLAEAEVGVTLESLEAIDTMLAAEGFEWEAVTVDGRLPVLTGSSGWDLQIQQLPETTSGIANWGEEKDQTQPKSTTSKVEEDPLNAVVPLTSKEELLINTKAGSPLRRVQDILGRRIKVSAVDDKRYAALLIPDHVGAGLDLCNCEALGDLLRRFLLKKKVICAIGYGVFALCAPSSSSSLPSDTLSGSTSTADTSRRLKGISNQIGFSSGVFDCESRSSVCNDGPSLASQSLPYCQPTYASSFSSKSDSGCIPRWPFVGRVLTGVSLFDEYKHPHFGKLPHSLEDLISLNGANFVQCPTDNENLLIDYRLITAPNSLSTDLALHNLCWLARKQFSKKRNVTHY